jgi:hypothetical protein
VLTILIGAISETGGCDRIDTNRDAPGLSSKVA